MAPLVTLYIIPIGLIAIVIIAIIRLIIRAANSGNSNNTTNYTNYNQPPNMGQPGQFNPGQNPYGQNPNPYNPNPNPYANPNPNPADPNSPPPIPNYENPGTFQQPDYKQPNYNQPNYTQSTYNIPGSGTYNPPPNTRSTSIGNTNYATHVGAPVNQGKNPALKIVLIIVGVIVFLGVGVAVIAYQRNEGGAAMISSEFRLAYDNPTENSYYIVLDDWDTIKVNPYTSTEDLDYMHRRDLTVHHWQMLDENRKVIADTTVTKDEMETWMSDRTVMYWNYSTVLFNPSATQYVYYNSWFDEEGLDYMDDVKVGDSTYFADAYTTKKVFIFDGRDPEYQTDLDEAQTTSQDLQQQFLLNQYDFVALYTKLNAKNPQLDMMEEFHDQLVDMFEVAKEEVMVNNAYDADDVLTCWALDSLTPGWVDEDTEPRDFIPAIDFVKANASLFRATARQQYNFVVDSADVLLKHSYVTQDRPVSFMKMTVVSYLVSPQGMFNDQATREESWSYERDADTGGYY